MSRKLWLGGALATAMAAACFMISPRLGGLVVILLALAAVAVAAFRFL